VQGDLKDNIYLWAYAYQNELELQGTKDKVFEMGGIGGIATWPEYRRNGMVAKLLLNALKIMMDP
jgi:predicted acetyltransferase